MANPRLTVEAPTFVPATGGLLAAATVVDMSDPHINNGVVFLAGPECGFAGFSPGLCETPAGLTSLVDNPLEYAGLLDAEGEPFAVYKGIECYLDGADDYEALAKAALYAGESHAVEIAVETLLLSAGTAISASAVNVVEALALVEEWAGNNYNGTPVIHVGRYGATYLVHQQVVIPGGVDGEMVTLLGTPVVVGSGYSGATSGEFDIWVTGQVTLWHGPTVVDHAQDTTLNKAQAVAQRVWSASIDCGVVGKITATTNDVYTVVLQ